ncbi:MAG: Maf family protein [bacterium]
MKRLILASASPRRAMLLRQIGIDFEQVVSRIDDEQSDLTDPGDHVLSISRRKAEDVARRTSEGLVLGADTVVVLDRRIMGKPGDRAAALQMLRKLSGRDHHVLTGLSLIDSQTWRVLSEYEETQVRMRCLSEEEIEDYVATGEPLGKAGGYAVQGLGATLVERIEGCYYNVVGLPIGRLLKLMQQMDFPFRLKACSKETENPFR